MCCRYSILPAITMDGIIECKIVEGSFNTDLFLEFIEDLVEKMQPFPSSKSVVIMDNCAIHKAPEVREMIEERCAYLSNRHFTVTHSCAHTYRGIKLEYLPAYSPDFNPIELAFSLLKNNLRRCPPPEQGDEFSVYEYLYLQVFAIPTANCRAFYHHTGYL